MQKIYFCLKLECIFPPYFNRRKTRNELKKEVKKYSRRFFNVNCRDRTGSMPSPRFTFKLELLTPALNLWWSCCFHSGIHDIYSRFSICSCSSLRLGSQMSRLRQMTRQNIVYFSTFESWYNNFFYTGLIRLYLSKYRTYILCFSLTPKGFDPWSLGALSRHISPQDHGAPQLPKLLKETGTKKKKRVTTETKRREEPREGWIWMKCWMNF